MKSLSPRRAEEISSLVLKRKDPGFSHIMHTSLQAVLFKYEEAWKPVDIDGSIYVYRRNTIPSIGLLILNRKSPTDFLLHIDPSIICVEKEDQLVVLKRAERKEMEIWGVWFYESYAAIQVAFILEEHLELMRKSSALMHLIHQKKKGTGQGSV